MMRFFFAFLIVCATLSGASQEKLRTLYNSLDPLSISQHFAFYELYPESIEGKKALECAWKLLSSNQPYDEKLIQQAQLNKTIHNIVALLNKQPEEKIPVLTDQEIAIIDSLAHQLPNRKLKGHFAQSEAEVLALPPEEIDLARSLFLTQLGNEAMQLVKSYEAMIDLMALQIAAKLPNNATPSQKIRTINDFIFGEMKFRFPPHSTHAKDIDVYTFLPSVLDSRKGVCLGVSILYICLAQRLNLPLEMITPPGHIYVRYRNGNEEINIETTARGIHIDSEEYLGIDTMSLQQRNIKEVIGLAHFNQASVFWQQDKYQEALNSYEKAAPYLPDDMLLKELTAYILILNQRETEGKQLLQTVLGHVPDYAVSGSTLPEDYLQGKVDADGIKALFLKVDETRESVLKKKDFIEEVVRKYPQFRTGWFALAVTWLQLHRTKEALHSLLRYHALDATDPTAEYYLTMLYAERHNYNKAWDHWHRVEKILAAKKHEPKLLQEVRRELKTLSPE